LPVRLLKNHHAANAGRALGVGDVVALNPVWGFGHAQNCLYLAQVLDAGGLFSLPANFEDLSVSRAFSAAICTNSLP
jgi:hypothetical protein